MLPEFLVCGSSRVKIKKEFTYAFRHTFRDSRDIKCLHLSARDQRSTWLPIASIYALHNLARSLRCPFPLSLRAKGREQLSAPRERTHSPYRKGCVRRARPASSLNRREWLRIAAATLRARRNHPSVSFSFFSPPKRSRNLSVCLSAKGY